MVCAQTNQYALLREFKCKKTQNIEFAKTRISYPFCYFFIYLFFFKNQASGQITVLQFHHASSTTIRLMFGEM